MNVICLVVDQLQAAFLGCYGNAWVSTPAWDRLAAESLVLDQATADSTQLDRIYDSFWSGLHPLARGDNHPSRPALLQQLSTAGYHCALISDDPWFEEQQRTAHFQEAMFVAPPDEPVTAVDSSETHFSGYFATALDWLSTRAVTTSEPFCLWLHTQGLALPWDAPREFREQYDDEETTAPDFTSVPRLMLPDNFDPDELLGICHAYAGQVSLLDDCLGGLMDWLRESTLAADTLVMVLSPRGFPLGEHRRVGNMDDALFNELLHLPWFLRLPDGSTALARSQALAQPADLYATLLDACGVAQPDEDAPAWQGQSFLPLISGTRETLRDRACGIAPHGERAIRTPGWFLKIPAADQPLARRLFAKPDDRCEVNDVADRCPQVVEQLEQALEQFATAASTQANDPLPALDELLVNGYQ